MAIDAELAAELGIAVDHPLALDATIDLTDPNMQELLASFEQHGPTAEELAEKLAAEEAERVAAVAADGETDAPVEKPTDEPDPELPIAATNFVVDLDNGTKAELTQADAQRLLGLDSWARGLPAQTVQAFEAVESGRGVVIPRDDFQAYLAWKAAGAQPAVQAPAAPTVSAADLDEYADPVVKAMYAEIQALKSSLQQQHDYDTEVQTRVQTDEINRHINARTEIFESTFTTAGAEAGLSPAELNLALQHAMDSRLILSVDTELAQRNPVTGTLIAEADPAQVARVTLERAIYDIPELRQRAIDAEVAKRLESERADIIHTNEKKNRAGSLSSAPTAATASSPRDPRTMSSMEIEAAIANELRATLAQG